MISQNLITFDSAISGSNTITSAVRVLSRESAKSGRDGGTFLHHYTSIMERPLLSFSAESDAAPTPTRYLLASAAELFADELCDGVFDELTFYAARNPQLDWDVLVASVLALSSVTGDAHPCTESWVDLLQTINQATSAFVANSPEMAHFCGEADKIVLTVAIAQVERMVLIDQRLDELHTASVTMRARHVADWAEMTRIHTAIDEMQKRLDMIWKVFSVVREAMEEQVSTRFGEIEVTLAFS